MSRNYSPWNSQRKTYQPPGNEGTDPWNDQHPRISHTGAHGSSDISSSRGFEGDPDASGYFDEAFLHSFSKLNASRFFENGSKRGIICPFTRTLR